jgi:hypothetical protein
MTFGGGKAVRCLPRRRLPGNHSDSVKARASLRAVRKPPARPRWRRWPWAPRRRRGRRPGPCRGGRRRPCRRAPRRRPSPGRRRSPCRCQVVGDADHQRGLAVVDRDQRHDAEPSRFFNSSASGFRSLAGMPSSTWRRTSRRRSRVGLLAAAPPPPLASLAAQLASLALQALALLEQRGDARRQFVGRRLQGRRGVAQQRSCARPATGAPPRRSPPRCGARRRPRAPRTRS